MTLHPARPRFSATLSGHNWLTHPADGASLAVFRILFGTLMAVAMVRFLVKGWVTDFFVTPTFFFTFEWFPWARPLPGVAMQALFVLLAVLAVGIAAGFRHRLCSTLFFLGFTYVELIDKTNYLNHYYLVSLVSGLMIFLPAHRVWSLDARQPTGQRHSLIPAWPLHLLRFQFSIVYFFAGVAKLNADWLLAAQPLRLWLAARADLPWIGPLLDEAWVAYAASWLGAAYDLCIPFLLLWRRTRLPAYGCVVLFHAGTAWLFPTIGMFPWLMIAATTVFFAPNWPRRWLPRERESQVSAPPGVQFQLSLPAFALLAAYVGVQTMVPLRQGFAPERAAWTGNGFNFAWRVMVAEKAGHVEYVVRTVASGKEWTVSPSEHLTPLQTQMMAQDPAMIVALAHHIAADCAARGLGVVEVRANAHATLNGRPGQRLVRPEVNLAGPLPPDWIVPLASTFRPSLAANR